MNTPSNVQFAKLPDNSWGIKSLTRLQPGQTVTVCKRDGSTSTATVAALDHVGADQLAYYSIAKTQTDVARPIAVSNVGELSAILALFAKVKGRLKMPAIALRVDAALSIRISIATARAKYPGTLTVLDNAVNEMDADGYGQRAWFGRIMLDGSFQPSRDARATGKLDAIIAKLAAFAADPAGVAGEDGRLNGRCCFCRLPIGYKDRDQKRTEATNISAALGYGRDCAEHYGLPWSREAAARSGRLVNDQPFFAEAVR